MSSPFGSSLSGNEGRIRAPMGRRAGKLFMSETQIEAYLIARDALRRIQRTSCVPTQRQAFDLGGGTPENRRRLDS